MNIHDLERYHLTIYDVKDQLKRSIYNRSLHAFAEGDKARDAIKTTEELEARRKFLREQFIKALGGLPRGDSPLNAKVTETIQCSGFKIEKVIFESRTDTFVTSNLYIPEGIASPRGAVLFVCGHHEQAKHHEEYQTVCQYLVNAGLVVLAIDPIGQGERLSYYEGLLQEATVRSCTGEHDYVGSQCFPLGDSLARYFVHDAMRAVDYLQTRPEVDPDKIGITGNSGGGTQVSLMMVCDPRIAAAAPATFIMNRESYLYAGGAQDAEQIWPGMTALGFDHEDILLCAAPRPVQVMAVTYDFFPIEGTRRTVARARRFWDLFEKTDCLQLVEDEAVHGYTAKLAKSAAVFFSKHLLGKTAVPSDERIQPLTPSDLWCTGTGQIRSESSSTRAVYEENCDRLAQLENLRDEINEKERKENALRWLRQKVFFNRKPCDTNARLHMLSGQMDGFLVHNSIWWAQEGIFNHAFIFTDYRFQGSELPLTIAVWDGGTSRLHAHYDWIRNTCASGRSVMVLDVSGVGPLSPHSLMNRDPLEFYEIIHKLTDDLIWLDDSLAAMRTYDVIRSLDMVEALKGINKDDIRMFAYGRYGMYAQLAALLDTRIKHIDVQQSMGSIAQWVRSRHYDSYDIMSVVLPGMLQYFDLPDLEEWLSGVKNT